MTVRYAYVRLQNKDSNPKESHFELNKKVFRFSNIVKATLLIFAPLIFGAVKAYAVVSGQQIWVKRYNGPENGRDIAFAMATDSNNNVYITGTCGGSIKSDISTIKYAP